MQPLTSDEPIGLANAPTEGMTHSSYATLLRDRGFQSFLWTQFLGAFNDNVFKMIVSVAALVVVLLTMLAVWWSRPFDNRPGQGPTPAATQPNSQPS